MREAAALQSFEDDYVFYPVDQLEPIARMIGNAVPPKLAKFFANYLVNSVVD
jgi:DNA (cytosine-5)-methyltransferase 1